VTPNSQTSRQFYPLAATLRPRSTSPHHLELWCAASQSVSLVCAFVDCTFHFVNHLNDLALPLTKKLETTYNLAELIYENDTISQTPKLATSHKHPIQRVSCSLCHISNILCCWEKVNRKYQFGYFLKNIETKLIFF